MDGASGAAGAVFRDTGPGTSHVYDVLLESHRSPLVLTFAKDDNCQNRHANFAQTDHGED